jgi:hypothetical protein
MGDIDDCVGGKGQRENRQRLSRIPDERRGRDEKKSNSDRNVGACAGPCLVRDSEADVGAANQRQEESRNLCEPKFRDQAFG